jgi:UDP-glucose 4-epimerase
VYGRPERQPIDEDAPVTPANPYAASKAAAERLIDAQCATGSLHATVLRIFNAAGAGDPDRSRILPKAVAVAAGHEPYLTVNGDGSAVRDFVHVRDIGAAIALSLDGTGYRAYNLGAVPASVRDIVDTARRVSGRAVTVRHAPAYPGEAAVLRADTTRIRAELGWQPECTSLDDMVREQWAATRP